MYNISHCITYTFLVTSSANHYTHLALVYNVLVRFYISLKRHHDQHNSFKIKYLFGVVHLQLEGLVLYWHDEKTRCFRGSWEFYISIPRHQEETAILGLDRASEVSKSPAPSDTPPSTKPHLFQQSLLIVSLTIGLCGPFSLKYHIPLPDLDRLVTIS